MREIQLTQGQVALVDDEDFERLSQYQWYADKRRNTSYAARGVKENGKLVRTVHMHTMLLDAKFVDHKDGNGLNNQRHNLRPATRGQNVVNSKKRSDSQSSPFKGVYFNKGTQKWMARCAGKYLGYFSTAEAAAIAYNAAAQQKYGEFARLNEVPG